MIDGSLPGTRLFLDHLNRSAARSLGINYSGSGLYNPSLDPANVAGFLLAGVTFVVVLAAIILKRRTEQDVSGP